MNLQSLQNWLIGLLAISILQSCFSGDKGPSDYQYETLESTALLAGWKQTLTDSDLPEEEL